MNADNDYIERVEDCRLVLEYLDNAPRRPHAARGPTRSERVKERMKKTVQPAVKDEDVAHPVASLWRPTFHEIAKAFACGDYGLTSGIPSVAKVSRSLAARMKATVKDYGETLADLPDESWKSSVAQWMGTHWDVLVDLWTMGPGKVTSCFMLECLRLTVAGTRSKLILSTCHKAQFISIGEAQALLRPITRIGGPGRGGPAGGPGPRQPCDGRGARGC